MGGVLAKAGRHADALGAFQTALDRAPADEVALAGSAEALAAMGRPTEAAEALDRLAAQLEAGDRLIDACDATRRGLELAESKERRRQLELITRRLRSTAPSDPVAQTALDQALGLLEPAERVEPFTRLGAIPSAGPKSGRPAPSAAARIRAAARALDLGDVTTARETLVAVTSAATWSGARDGQSDVDSDAAHGAGSQDGDVALERVSHEAALHLAFAELYLERGWTRLASEKLGHLAWIVELAASAAPGAAPTNGLEAGSFGPERSPDPFVLVDAAQTAIEAGDTNTALEALVGAALAHGAEGRRSAALDAGYQALALAPADTSVHLAFVELYLARSWASLASDKLVLLVRLADLDADVEAKRRICRIARAAIPDDARLAELCT